MGERYRRYQEDKNTKPILVGFQADNLSEAAQVALEDLMETREQYLVDPNTISKKARKLASLAGFSSTLHATNLATSLVNVRKAQEWPNSHRGTDPRIFGDLDEVRTMLDELEM